MVNAAVMPMSYNDTYQPKRGLGQVAEALGIGHWDRRSLKGTKDFLFSPLTLRNVSELIADFARKAKHSLLKLNEIEVVKITRRYFTATAAGANEIDKVALGKANHKNEPSLPGPEHREHSAMRCQDRRWGRETSQAEETPVHGVVPQEGGA
jgi:hypothetical protein